MVLSCSNVEAVVMWRGDVEQTVVMSSGNMDVRMGWGAVEGSRGDVEGCGDVEWRHAGGQVLCCCRGATWRAVVT